MTEQCALHVVHTGWPYISCPVQPGIIKVIGICMTCQDMAVSIMAVV